MTARRLPTVSIRTKVHLGFALVLVFLITIGFIAQYRLQHSIQDGAWASHTEEVLGELIGAAGALGSAESHERGFILTGEQTLRERFQAAKQQTFVHLAKLRALTADNPAQQKRLDRLEPLMRQMLVEEEAALRREVRSPGQSYKLASIGDEDLMKRIRSLYVQIGGPEGRLLRQRSQASRQSSAVARAAVAIGSILGAISVFLCSLLVARHLRRREIAEARLIEMQQGLEERVKERTAELASLAASLQREISDRQQAEEQLRESERRHRMLFEDSPVPMVVYDTETLDFLAQNPAVEELFGYTREELGSRTLRDLQAPEGLAEFEEQLKDAKTLDPYRRVNQVSCKDGRKLTVESRGRTVQFGGRPARLSLITDITEQKRLESQLQQSQKMEAVGRLAGGIAHDFNNLLTVILGYSDTILRKLDLNNPMHSRVSEIQAAGRRAADLTGQLLAFSRKQILQPQTLQLNSVVSNISQMLRRLLGEDIQVTLHLDAALGQIQADPTQLEQVLVNLAVNARDAMPDGGKLVIETDNAEITEQSALLQGIPRGKYILLAVSDTGCGMDESTKAKIFEPFFTTKEVGKGTGLGLSMVLGVVQQSGGTVTVYSEPGVGTTFRLYLPRCDSPVSQPEESTPKALPAAKGERILLVEDEDRVRALACEILQDAGYQVLEARNGLEALEIAATFAEAPALLVTDVVMPKMSGPQLADRLRIKWPNLPVVLTSGYTDRAVLGRGSLPENTPFLQKPYTPASLVQQVHATLERTIRPTVLVIDDEANIRQLLRTIFEEGGYTVIEAINGREALAKMSGHDIKLVVTDLVMPEQEGLETIQTLRRRFPEVKILAISGAFAGSYLKMAGQLGADRVLPKPFQREQVLKAAEESLA